MRGGCGLRLVSRGLHAAAPALLGSDPPNREWTASPLSGAPPRGPAHAEPSGDLAWVRRPQVTAVWMRPRTPSENRGGCVPGGLRTPSACSLLGPDTLLGSPPSTVSLWVWLHLGGSSLFQAGDASAPVSPVGKGGLGEAGGGAHRGCRGGQGHGGRPVGHPRGRKQQSRAGGARGSQG